MDEIDALLIRLYATGDAVWRAIRGHEWGSDLPANLYVARLDFPSHGVQAVGGGAGSERVGHLRLLDEARLAGLLTVSRAKNRNPFAKLTLAGEERVRELCGLPGPAESLALIRELIALPFYRPPCCPGDWRAEADFTTLPLDPNVFKTQLWRVELEALPAIRCGWLLATSTVQGTVLYRATPAGCKAAKESAVGGAIPDDGPAFGEYVSARSAARAQLCQAAPPAGEIGILPISVAIGHRHELAAHA